MASGFTITEEPVVVNPEMDSKAASVKLCNVPEKRYGRAPQRGTVSHATEVIQKLSCSRRS